jgi:uncharacterized protein YuzE
MTLLGSAGTSENVHRVDALAILDLDTGGEVLGVEVLQASRFFDRPLQRAGDAFKSVKFDPDADAVYVRIREGGIRRGQEARNATFYVDPDGVLLGIDVDWSGEIKREREPQEG